MNCTCGYEVYVGKSNLWVFCMEKHRKTCKGKWVYSNLELGNTLSEKRWKLINTKKEVK